MASATLTVSLSNKIMTITPSNVIPEGSVTVSGTGKDTEVSLTPQSPTDTTFSLTFVQGAGVVSLNSLLLPVPFGLSKTLSVSQGDGSILALCFNVPPFQGQPFDFRVLYLPTGSNQIVFEDPTIVFNPPSGSPETQLYETPVVAEPVMV